jgi:methylmalonyl-CoA/ethylmalonyl-CoA epimerase
MSNSLLKSAAIAAMSLMPIAAMSLMLVAAAQPAAPTDLPPLQDHGFAQIGLQVSDLDRSTTFYSRVLGLRLLFSSGGMVFFQAGGARLMIERGEPGHSTTIYLEDDNLERDKPLLEARGIAFAGPVETVQRTADYDLKLLEFSDPDGNPLALMGRVPHHPDGGAHNGR